MWKETIKGINESTKKITEYSTWIKEHKVEVGIIVVEVLLAGKMLEIDHCLMKSNSNVIVLR